MRMLTKAHEWAADHFSFVQYPRIRAIAVENSGGLRFKHRMAPSTRLALVAMSLFCLAVGAAVVSIVAAVFWALVTG